ncbi:immune inhibitor A domain-containing protein [Anaeromyxobacter terrae]|uniref:immune inhibitor A domain-containing protein n=1 Tax=Anaeromyxobacter terrae TaxID=2925406 RepID=UPI001F587FFD|nr:immune inhibitor A domain-containing protein [Anaeromyxobacter sp. SG22]
MIPKRVVVGTIAVAALLAATPARAEGAASGMPPNVDKIAQSLIRRGVIPANATEDQVDAAVKAYVGRRLANLEHEGNRLARKRLEANEAALGETTGAIRGRKLGNTVDVPASTPGFKPLVANDKLLLLLVDFSSQPFTWQTTQGERTAAGPLHDQIPEPDNDYDLWVPQFTREHYEQMLFNDGGWEITHGAYTGQRRPSMRDYYLAQSFGQYTISGDAYGWFTVGKPEAYYGDNDADGNDLAPGNTWDLIRDAVGVVNAQGAVPWEEYDADGNCVLDHVLIIHAGVDESAGGGAQGEDAIWAHSWDVMPPAPVTGPTARCPGGLVISNYTIMPEDGGVGVFAHEFGHDLGLPDEYDTAYSGRGDSIANWSIMSQGSWAGVPAQTEPSNMSIWARYSLGFLGDTVGRVNVAALGKDPVVARLDQASYWGGPGTLSALRVDLPANRVVLTTPHSGTLAFWGGRADLLDNVLSRTVDLTGKTSASLSFWTWYDIEPGWDFGFVQVSTDGGATWTSLPLAGTTSTHDGSAMPEIVAQLPGFTGRSGGWQQKTADLSAYAGQHLIIAFRYMTDWGSNNAGFFVDDVTVAADGATVLSDGAETAQPGWLYQPSNGWRRSDGTQSFGRYYMLEWRNNADFSVSRAGAPIRNPDAGLQHCTQYDAYGSTGNPNMPWLYAYSPGLVLWFRDMSWTNNWTGAHPGHGYLLVVDSHDQPIMRPSGGVVTLDGVTSVGVGSYPFNTHVQSSDAAFSLERAVDNRLGYFGVTRDYSGLTAVPSFDDSLTYWSRQTPAASTLLPTFGFQFRVLGEATDGSAALVGLGRK